MDGRYLFYLDEFPAEAETNLRWTAKLKMATVEGREETERDPSDVRYRSCIGTGFDAGHDRSGIGYVYDLSAKGVNHALQNGYSTLATKTIGMASRKSSVNFRNSTAISIPPVVKRNGGSANIASSWYSGRRPGAKGFSRLRALGRQSSGSPDADLWR